VSRQMPIVSCSEADTILLRPFTHGKTLIDKLIPTSTHTKFRRVTMCHETFTLDKNVSCIVVATWQFLLILYPIRSNFDEYTCFSRFNLVYPWNFIFFPIKRRSDGGVCTCHVLMYVKSIRCNFFNRHLRMKPSKISIHIDVV